MMNQNNNCELCRFKNPRGCATAIIIKDNKLLVLKRNEEPFRGAWDLPGGYMNGVETPEQTIRREIKEELGLAPRRIDFIRTWPGTALWKDESFPIIGFFYLVDIGDGKIDLNNEENSVYDWIPLKELNPECIAWDSNRLFAAWLKENFTFDLVRVRELVSQLDPSTAVFEQALYWAVMCGYVYQEFDGDRLIGMGWIFPRQTALRFQAVVEDMIVDDAYRGKGLGKKILLELLRWAKERGVEVVELATNPKRVAANELYKSVGFWLHPTNHYLLNL